MHLQFFSNDKLAWIYPFDESYGVTLVRNGITTYRVIPAKELIDIIDLSMLEDGIRNKACVRAIKIRVRFAMTIEEAVRLKECYLNMKSYYGHYI